MASDQMQQLKQQQQLLVAREQRLKYLQQQRMLQRDNLAKGNYYPYEERLGAMYAGCRSYDSNAFNSKMLGKITRYELICTVIKFIVTLYCDWCCLEVEF
jgi:hypothetical protein